MPTFLTTAKYALRKLTGANLIADIDAGFQALADDVDTNMAGWATGPLGSRPTSTAGSPGKAGRIYYTTDTGQAFLDFGTGWIEITLGGVAPVWQSGDIKLSGGAATPTGWLPCDGAAVDRTTYAGLFTAIGTAHGAGNGTTTFNVPDLKGRVPVGAGAGTGLTARALGSKFGEESHILTAAELAAHDHGAAGGHQHTFTTSSVNALDPALRLPYSDTAWGAITGAMGGGQPTSLTEPYVPSPHGIGSVQTPTHNHTGITDNAAAGTHTHASVGSGQAHNNVPPSQAVSYVIKT